MSPAVGRAIREEPWAELDGLTLPAVDRAARRDEESLALGSGAAPRRQRLDLARRC